MKTLIKAFSCVLFTAISPLLYATEDGTRQADIIYEYKIITQKKGQSLDAALKTAKLSPYQTQLIRNIPVMRAAKSDRQFRLAYAVENKQRLLREVRVTRGNRRANFVLTGTDGKHRFVSQASNIPEKVVPTAIKLESAKSTAAKSTAKPTTKLATKQPGKILAASLFAVTFQQQQGQSLANAMRPVKLSRYQQQIIHSGKFIKSARSTRQFTLFFERSGKRRLLKGVTIVRGKNRVDFLVEKKGKQHQLTNIKTLPAVTRQQVSQQFAAMKVTQSIKPAPKLVSTVDKADKKSPPQTTPVEPTQKNTTLTQSTTRTQGNYQLVSFQQNKGQSIASVLNRLSLTSAQRKLTQQIPVMQQAKSTRTFHLLFEQQGAKKYLRAAKVVRGKQQADFVLAKDKGKWTWANNQGEINSGKGGFLRYPLTFSRISSGYNLRRRHPITRRIRPHKGTDFKAPHGRAIWAPADGVVSFAGRQRGYGITLEIDHQNGYKTKYAHLSRISRGVRKGARVKQKQIVARVGNTGLSSGAHLHYEVIVNGRHRNPMTVKLPGGSGKKVTAEAKRNAAKYLPRLRRMMK